MKISSVPWHSTTYEELLALKILTIKFRDRKPLYPGPLCISGAVASHPLGGSQHPGILAQRVQGTCILLWDAGTRELDNNSVTLALYKGWRIDREEKGGEG